MYEALLLTNNHSRLGPLANMPNKQLILDHVPGCPFEQDFKSALSPEDFQDVQGDILVPFPKRTEDFCFFEITNPEGFKKALATLITDGKISSTEKVANDRKEIAEWKDSGRKDLKAVQNMNISFTYNGLKTLGFDPEELPSSGRQILHKGQLADASNLGDPLENGKPKDWLDQFKNKHDKIHGVLLVACDSGETVEKCRQDLTALLGGHVDIIYQFQGDTRSNVKNKDKQTLKDHEHFGWKDGISNPWLKDVFCECRKIPGQPEIDRGIVLLGHPGDHNQSQEIPDGHWAKNGSYLVCRKLAQLVPEFHKFMFDNPVALDIPGLTPDQLRKRGADLRAAQFVGRWPLGTPLEISALEEKPDIAGNAQENNKFIYNQKDQSRCPFSAHIRKMNPRQSEGAMGGHGFGKNFLIRQGITYGPEVTENENSSHKSDPSPELSRGLAFVSYQSDITEGFQFQQKSWANFTGFPITAPIQPGFDPLIGQARSSQQFTTQDTHNNPIRLQRFVRPLGGTYSFLPSIKALKKIAGIDV
ncbi:unnamed protein product [Rhizoctonia solani]|uniref:DyP dimeric alpha+beta barrel domain-containing protein n=1 Tax=Rhizoctonia solani TaxID=456999 RepID=A0A8H3BHB4_9AGAM|nr:unnamed protein product [Rhizoctonia solani]